MTKPRKIIRLVKRSEYQSLHISKSIAHIKVYLTTTYRGFAHFDRNYVTIPAYAEIRGVDFFLYYIAHELAHILRYQKFGDEGCHDKKFYRCFREICPVELQHHELDYKPRGAKLSKEVVIDNEKTIQQASQNQEVQKTGTNETTKKEESEMKHYTKAELKLKAIAAADAIREVVGSDEASVNNAICTTFNPPNREPTKLELQVIGLLDEHKQARAILEQAVSKGIINPIAVDAKAQAEAEDNNPEHVRVRKEAKKRKTRARKTIDKVVGEQPVEKKTRKPQQRKKVSNFDNVDNGICPHCQQETLAKEVAGKGDGVTRTCTKCQHKWYLNRKIRTCKCLTCPKGEKKV